MKSARALGFAIFRHLHHVPGHNQTPYRWVTEYRIAKVKELLLAGDAMSDVAMKCGFADQSHMTRTFQGVTGETPGKWRGRHR
ncbi:helix-turn-helix transcriptional regulator [Rhizobium miluonense]|uniref:helix-turn-helix transcriptional regulator n=1 Tax=Rhizobium miluonense TaxID=411945 RepID=UPI000B87DAC6|nr:helix-turn-helix transcriptional regulator [Rhizobium miluonense]